MPSLPDFGYFSLWAITGRNHTDDHDLFKFETQSLSERVPENGTDFSKLNRKIIYDYQLQRRKEKLHRREGMKSMVSYTKNETSANFSDSLRLVGESVWRVKKTVNKTMLDHLINSKVKPRIEHAKEHIESAGQFFSSLKTDLDQMWSHFHDELISVQEETRNQMKTITHDLTAYAQILTRGQEDSPATRAAYQDALQEMDDPNMTWMMEIVCLVELLAFAAFFVLRVKRMKGFKKTD
jgi:hypothetical protein